MTTKYSLGLVGRKAGMSRVFTEDGRSVPVTLIEATPNRVTQIKTVETDGYSAVQVTVGAQARVAAHQAAGRPLRQGEGRRRPWPVGAPRRCRRDRQVRSRRRDQGRRIFAVGQMVDVAGIIEGQGLPGHDQALELHDGRRDPR